MINADRGYGVSLEPAWRPIDGGGFAKSEIYAFADYARGDVFSRSSGDTISLDLGSYGAALRAAYDEIGVPELEFARAYDQPRPRLRSGLAVFYRLAHRHQAVGEMTASQSWVDERDPAAGRLIMSPPFITKVTRSISLMSSRGFPSTAIMSASMPAFI